MNTGLLKRLAPLLAILLVAGLSSGCASTTVNGAYNPDPYEDTNRSLYAFNDALDRHFFKPVSQTYANITPQPVRTGVTNFFNNLEYLNVILHAFLQWKLGQGFSDVTRFVVNSSFGLGGLLDVATLMGLTSHEEDFGQTLHAWGADQGAYLNLPFFGPNTARNTPDLASRYFTNPLTYISGLVLLPVTALNLINSRANLLEATAFVDEASLDPYAFTREAYLQRRQYLIHDGSPPTEDYDDIFESGIDDDSTLVIE